MADCMVIGAGVIGLLTARELCAAGLTVTLLERGETGREASWAGGGILAPLHPWRAPGAVTALSRWSRQQYPRLAQMLLEETGIDPQWTQNGLLVLEDGEHSAARAWAAQHGEILESLAPADLQRREAALARQDAAALWLPEVAQIRNPRLVQALKQSLIQRGVVIKEHTEAHTLVLKHDAVVSVQTSSGVYTADKVIVAAGAWSGALLEGLGWTPALTPVRGQMLLYRAAPGLLSHIVVHGEHYLIPRRDGRVLVGSTVERVGFDKSTTAAARETLHHAACSLIPALTLCEIEQQWAGLRPGTASGVPWIGVHPRVKNLFINSGHFRNGIALAPASARLVTDSLLGRHSFVNPAPYLPAILS